MGTVLLGNFLGHGIFFSPSGTVVREFFWVGKRLCKSFFLTFKIKQDQAG